MSIENIQSKHLTDAVNSTHNVLSNSIENLNTESIKSIDNPVLSNSMNNVNTVSRESSDNLAFITVESNKNHVTANDEKTGSGNWLREKKEEGFDKTQESYQNFTDTIHSDETLEMYDRNLTRFLKVSDIKSYDEVAEMSRKDIQEKLKQHVRFLKNNPKIHANSITGTMAGIFKFLIANEVDFNDKNIKSMYPDTKKPLNAEAYSLEQMQMIVARASQSPNKRNMAIVLTTASSGMRKGAVVKLRMRDLKPIEDTFLIVVYAGEKEEYVTFMTPESAEILRGYFAQRKAKGEILTDESYVFTCKQGLGKPMQVVTFGSVVTYLLQKSNVKDGLTKDEERGRYNIAGIHGMRKFCDTQMEESGVSHSKLQKMIGHMNGLAGLYYDAKSDKLYQEYKKAIPLLTIQKHVIEQNKVAELQGQLSANDFIKSEEIRTQEAQLASARQDQIEQMAKMQEKIAELEIRLSQKD